MSQQSENPSPEHTFAKLKLLLKEESEWYCHTGECGLCEDVDVDEWCDTR